MNKYNTSQLEKDVLQLGITLTDAQISQLMVYYEMLVEWNGFMNLTAITDFEDVMKKHFTDSMSLIRAYDLKQKTKLIDVGTGAGFPGLVLKIVFPDLEITLLDSLNKRIQFLNAVIEKLKLSGVETIHGRAEDSAKRQDLREAFDLVVSRAVSNLSTLSEYCIPFVKVGGYFIPYKSEKISEETKEAKNAIHLLGGKLLRQIDFYLPDSDIYRNFVVIEKISSTPNKYPRKAGMPSKEPL